MSGCQSLLLSELTVHKSSPSNHSAAWRVAALIPALVGMTAVGLMACGGGGADVDNASTGTGAAVAAAVKLDATNYKTASAAVVDAGFGLADLDLNTLTSAKAKASAVRSALKVFASVRQALEGNASSGAKGGAWSGASHTSTNCSGGGTITIDTNLAQAAVNTAGDRFAITYDNCIDLQARTETDGKHEFVLTHAGLGDYFVDPAYNVRVTYTFTQLRTVGINGTHVVDGSIELESVRTALRQGYDSFTAPRLESSFTPPAGPRSWSALQGFVARKDYASSTTTTTLDGVVSANDGSSEGSVTVDTTTPFVRAIGRYPHVGVLTATGDQGTKVEVRAIDDTSVRLSLDSNGDGSWDRVEDVAWVTLW